MTWPTDDLTNTHLDAANDDPSQARAELNSLLLKVKAILGEVQAGATVYSTANLPSSEIVIPSGSRMLFQQTSAPTGWTKISTYNDRALRVVSGTAGAGGSSTFSATFAASRPTDAQGAHAHTPGTLAADANTGQYNGSLFGAQFNAQNMGHTHTISGVTSTATAHTHSLAMAVQYVDVILASKN